MNSIKQVRFIATNFYNLQGLRVVPLGICLVLVIFWANGLHGPARDFFFPLLILMASLILLFVIDRYYLHTFGRVERTPESRHLEWVIGVIGGVFALGAFWLDVSFNLPVSLLGFVFSIGLLADYIRITWFVKGRYLLYYPLGAILMAGVSGLDLLGFSNWWQAIGLKSQLLGVATAIGMFVVLAGIWGHIFLVRTLPAQVETNNDHSV